jgi:hypothetical protein
MRFPELLIVRKGVIQYPGHDVKLLYKIKGTI